MLLQSLAPLIGAEREAGNKAVRLGWADHVSKEDMESWAEDGMELKNELEEYIKEVFSETYWKLMREVSFLELMMTLQVLRKFSKSASPLKRFNQMTVKRLSDLS